jgi:hypothetical protein
LHAFFSQSFLEAVHGACIFDFDVGSFSARLHHQFTADSIEREGDGLTGGHNELGEEELLEEVGLLLSLIITKDQTFASVITSKVEGTVDKNTDHRDSVALVKTQGSVDLHDFLHAVAHTVKLALGSITTHVGTETSSGKVEGVDNSEANGSGKTYLKTLPPAKRFPRKNLNFCCSGLMP